MNRYLKIFSLLLALAMLLCCAGCSSSDSDDPYAGIPDSTEGKDVTRNPGADNLFSLNCNTNYSFNPLIATNRSNQLVCSLVYENMVVNEDEADCMKSIVIFHNKIVIRNDDTEEIRFVLCKTEGDAIKFYNLIEKRVRKDKLLRKRIFFIGWCESDSPLGYKLREQIHDLTGWKDKKITMVSNTYYASTVNILKRQKEEMRRYCEEHGIPFIDEEEDEDGSMGDEGAGIGTNNN